MKQAINQKINQTINQTNKQTINQTIKQSINQSNNQTNNQSIKQSNNQTMKRSINQWSNQTTVLMFACLFVCLFACKNKSAWQYTFVISCTLWIRLKINARPLFTNLRFQKHWVLILSLCDKILCKQQKKSKNYKKNIKSIPKSLI